MCEHKQESEAKRDKMQRFLSVTDRVIAHKVRTVCVRGGGGGN